MQKGNTGGLAGMEGIQYALGEGSPDIISRPLPLALGRMKMALISPVTKIEADSFVLDKFEKKDVVATIPKEDAAAAKQRILQQAKAGIERAESAKKEAKEKAMATKARASLSIPPPTPSLTVSVPPRINPPQEAKQVKAPNIEIPKVNLELPKINLPRPTLQIPVIALTKLALPRTGTTDKMVIIRKKQQSAKERLAIETKRKRAAAELTREKQRQKRMQEQARVQTEIERKQEAQRMATAKKNAEERRQKLEDQRQAQIAARKKEEQQRQAAAIAALKKLQKESQAKTQTFPRPSFELPRPSLPIPRPSTPVQKKAAAPSTAQSRPSFSLPRPSLTIPNPSVKPQKQPQTAKQPDKRPSFSGPLTDRASSPPPKQVADPKPAVRRPSFALFQPAKRKQAQAPEGVPTVVQWRVRSDGKSNFDEYFFIARITFSQESFFRRNLWESVRIFKLQGRAENRDFAYCERLR
jgi:hypothetical protein